MKISWKIEIINPCDNTILKTLTNSSVQGIVEEWKKATNNNYLTSVKIYNIYHKKKKDGLIKVYKYDPKVSDSSEDDSD